MSRKNTKLAVSKARHLDAAMRAICELMKARGVSHQEAKSRLESALQSGFSKFSSSAIESRRFTRLCDVCTRWYIERDFVDERGKPLPLVWNGSSGSLRKLVTRVVGASDAREVIDQLIAKKLIFKSRNGRWLPKSRVVAPIGVDDANIARTSAMVGRLLKTILYNGALNYKGDVLLEVMAQVPRLPRRYAPSFRKFAKAQGLSFIKSIDDWLESRNLQRVDPSSKKSFEAGVVAFAFQQKFGD